MENLETAHLLAIAVAGLSGAVVKLYRDQKTQHRKRIEDLKKLTATLVELAEKQRNSNNSTTK